MNRMERHLNKVIRGQVRSYMNDHPEMFSNKGRSRNSRFNVENGVAKRLLPEFCAVLQLCGVDVANPAFRVGPPHKDPSGVALATAPEGHKSFWRFLAFVRGQA